MIKRSSLQEFSLVAGRILVFTLICGTLLASHGWAQTRVMGREISWIMIAPEGWVGGSYYQLEKVIHHVGNSNPKLREILLAIQERAKNREASVMHLEDGQGAATKDPSFSSRTLTEILVSFRPSKNETNQPQDPVSWEKTAVSCGDLLSIDYPSPTRIQLVSHATVPAGDRTANEAVYRLLLGSGGSKYHAITVVPVAGKGRLYFSLEVDSSRYPARIADMRQMIRSLRL